MKRVRVAPGRHIWISAKLADKAARLAGSGLRRDQVRELMATEPKQATGVMMGGTKPLALSRAKARRDGKSALNDPRATEAPT